MHNESIKYFSKERFLKLFDHTIIKPNLTEDIISNDCQKARELNIATVVVQPAYVSLCSNILSGSLVLTGVPIGFPHGGHKTITKVFEAEQALRDGAQEMDMVINVIKLKSQSREYVRKDIEEVVSIGHSAGIIVKVILCVGYLTHNEIIEGCKIAEESGADFVKTSTGFDPSGATPEVVKLMKNVVNDRIQIKAAQGIDSLEKSLDLIEAGAMRLGTSNTFKIIDSYLDKTSV